MHPAAASQWIKLPEHHQQTLLSEFCPVNDHYIPLWTNTNKINLLYGSYGSGKSVFVADLLVDKCLEDKYFRCYYGRKILDTVRGTVFKTLTDRIKDRKLEKFFTFSDAPNGSMNIVCKLNGNEFIPFGANDSQSLKSIKDPSHFWLEEMDQFSFEDFGFIYSRLRTIKTVTQLYGSFNTDRVYQSHWIRKVLFEGEFAKDAHKLKCNYYHNLFLDQADYLSKLKMIANGDIAKLNAIAEGEWGVVRTGGEFWKQFDETKHVKPVSYEPGVINVSLDENVNPYVTCTVWQLVDKNIRQIAELLCKSPDNNAPKAAMRLVKYLKSIGHRDVVNVWGDPSANRRSTVDPNNSSFYDKFIEVLKAEGYTVSNRVARSAPEVALSAAFINDIYENEYNGWSITISDRCFGSIEDYILVKEDAEGKMAKPKVKDEDTKVTYEPAGHISDTKRYFITGLLAADFNKYGVKNNYKIFTS